VQTVSAQCLLRNFVTSKRLDIQSEYFAAFRGFK
jgi:hypothetical protein